MWTDSGACCPGVAQSPPLGFIRDFLDLQREVVRSTLPVQTYRILTAELSKSIEGSSPCGPSQFYGMINRLMRGRCDFKGEDDQGNRMRDAFVRVVLARDHFSAVKESGWGNKGSAFALESVFERGVTSTLSTRFPSMSTTSNL